ncbi:MAG: adenine deaminase C-terminal domain-containing protein [Acetobacter fabarum]|uniref:adenine deaminase n=1 Tax=Acetobacter fabarum TaxID=483199 RepID=UPI0039E755BA
MKSASEMMSGNDLFISAAQEVRIRQELTRVAMGLIPADLVLRVGRLLDVHTRRWVEQQDIVMYRRRIAWTGPAGTYTGTARAHVERLELSAVPGFGEVHKHIESSHLTPEYEAALVLPRGNTWTCEASHEFSNVDGAHNLSFWMTARSHGVPLKIFPLPGSAVPPTAYEGGGGYYGYDEQSAFMGGNLMVPGLDEVMDWPSVWNPESPSYARLWGMIQATYEHRGVVEGHGAGLHDTRSINAFAAAGLASDHEVLNMAELQAKLQAGIFVALRHGAIPELVRGMLDAGFEDFSQIALTTDDRSANDTLRMGATDYNVRRAMEAGLPPEIAIQCVTINPARHMRLTPWVGSLAPGRFADVVLLSDVAALDIAEVWADGQCVAQNGRYIAPMPAIAWPAWASQTINITRELVAEDFAIPADPGRQTMQAAVLRPFHWADDFLVETLPVQDGQVQRDTSQCITKFAVVDRYSGQGRVGRMFWRGCGPSTPDTAVGCSVAHDQHNIWVVGSSDAAMAQVVNQIRRQQGGWALVRDNTVLATVRYEVGGLMTARPAEALDADMQELYAQARTIEWMHEPTYSKNWPEGFPERLCFATLTCSPWRWVLVAPNPSVPEGFVNVQTGQTHPIVW